MIRIDAAQHNGVSHAEIGQRKDIVEVSGRDGACLDAAIGPGLHQGGGIDNGCCGLICGRLPYRR